MTTFTDAFRSDFNDTSVPREGDILWRNQAGDNVVWLMNNNTRTTTARRRCGKTIVRSATDRRPSTPLAITPNPHPNGHVWDLL